MYLLRMKVLKNAFPSKNILDFVSENYNISTNNIINVKDAKVLWQ
jgi:hypothetical protein